MNGPVLILDTKLLIQGNSYTIGCELHNDIVFPEIKNTAMAKVNLFQQLICLLNTTIHNKYNYYTLGIVKYMEN